MQSHADIDIARDLKSIEWLKVELLEGVTGLFKGMRDASDEVILDRLISVILSSYIIGRRFGVDFNRLDLKLKQAVRANAEDPHDFEQWYGDFSALAKHFDARER